MQPTLYIPHGAGPCFFMDWTPADTWKPLEAYLRGLIASLPSRPTAILVVSAHWECARPTLQSGATPCLLFDYGGFPPHTYELRWPAPGAPGLAVRMQESMSQAGIATDLDGERGFDHGVFVPLLVSLPDADIPTLQLSLKQGLDPEVHRRMGAALTAYREEGVLIVGSGLSYHNMGGFGRAGSLQVSRDFHRWLEQVIADPSRHHELDQWRSAPGGLASHPREEHLLPLMVCAGAAPGEAGRFDFHGEAMGVEMAAVRFG